MMVSNIPLKYFCLNEKGKYQTWAIKRGTKLMQRASKNNTKLLPHQCGTDLHPKDTGPCHTGGANQTDI